jgi:SAM-dependent methyltransferase
MINQTSNDLAEVFKDVDAHQKIAGIMVNHATNSKDIRKVALDGIDLSNVQQILDLGCGFGFFTRALLGIVNSGAKITGIDCHPQNRDFYLDSTKKAEIDGKFIGECITSVRRIKTNTIDLILCSYALYFFPEILPQISRILKDDGIFIVITHNRNHLIEIGSRVKQLVRANDEGPISELPYEVLINKFSGENGELLLKPWFEKIKKEEYKNSLIFQKDEMADLELYLKFKHSFFIPEKEPDKETLFIKVVDYFKGHLEEFGKFEISKNDVIFICTKPLMKGGA